MIAANWFGLLAGGIKRGRRRALLSGLGIMAGVAALTYFLALGQGIRVAVLGRWIKDLPAEEIYVTVPIIAIGPIQVDRPRLLGGGKTLDDRIVERLKNLTVSVDGHDVQVTDKVWRQLDADFPASITGNLMGVAYGTDTAVSGVDSEMVIEDVKVGSFSYQPGPDSGVEVPALVPTALLDVYNSAFARAQDLPQLNPGFLMGKHFTMQLGVSSISTGSAGSVLQTQGVIVGLTNRGALLGVTVPIQYVEEWNKRLGRANYPAGYRALTIVARDPRYVPAITDAVRRMGFEARSNTGLAERVGGIIAVVTAGLSLVAGVILFVAGLNAWSLFRLMAMERRKEMGLLMALGATRGEVRLLVMAEAAAIGLAGGLSGSLIAAFAGWITNRILQYFSDIPFLPDRLILFSTGIIFLGIISAVLVALFSAWSTARQLSLLTPDEILA